MSIASNRRITPARRMPFWATSAVAGVAGALAINLYLIVAETFVLKSATVVAISQWDASNLLGLSAFDGGVRTAAIGFGMHLIVSTAWATLFTAIVAKAPAITARPMVTGIIFGLIVMLVMLVVVVPLGHAPTGHATLSVWIDRAVAHTLFFGVPVAWVVAKLDARTSDARARSPIG